MFSFGPRARARTYVLNRPSRPLRIDPRYFSNPADLVPLRASLRRLTHPALRECGYALDNMEVLQGEDDMVFDKFIRQRNQTAYHYSCGMAVKEDASGGGDVVGPQLRVFGVEGLRVADLSMFPWVIRVHLQAPVVYIAEHARRW
jgi:choline dehydrogenase